MRVPEARPSARRRRDRFGAVRRVARRLTITPAASRHAPSPTIRPRSPGLRDGPGIAGALAHEPCGRAGAWAPQPQRRRSSPRPRYFWLGDQQGRRPGIHRRTPVSRPRQEPGLSVPGLSVAFRRARSDARSMGLLARLCECNASQVELWERWVLLNRPWEEDWLHWAADGRLHGTCPPPDHRRHSVTSTGWCLGQRSDQPNPER